MALKDRRWPWYVKYPAAFAAGVAAMLIVFYAQGLWVRSDPAAIYKVLSNGCFLAAVLLMGVGLLSVSVAGGTFDILVYGIQLCLSVFRLHPEERKSAKDFYEYRKKKAGRKSLWFLVIVGAVFMAAAVVFTVLFEAVYAR